MSFQDVKKAMDNLIATLDQVKAWTFIIRGGAPFQLALQKKVGPGLDHQGKRTIWKMMGTEKEAETVATLLKSTLVGAQVEYHTETEDEEMVAQRHQGES